MLLGYARVSKADGSQLLDLQVDALREAGIYSERIYQDRMSGGMISGRGSTPQGLARGRHLVRLEAGPARSQPPSPRRPGRHAAAARVAGRAR